LPTVYRLEGVSAIGDVPAVLVERHSAGSPDFTARDEAPHREGTIQVHNPTDEYVEGRQY
jgi:hypothetical protein